MEGTTQANVCGCLHHKMMPAFVVVFGLLFWGETFGWWGSQVVNIGWPGVLIVAGLFKMMEGKCKCC